jgi:hypothetical protein
MRDTNAFKLGVNKEELLRAIEKVKEEISNICTKSFEVTAG